MAKYYVMYSKNRKVFWEDLTYKIIREENGKYICQPQSMYSFHRDIIELDKNQYQAIELNEDFYIEQEGKDPSQDKGLLNREPIKEIQVYRNLSESDQSFEGETLEVIAENEQYIQIKHASSGLIGLRTNILMKDGFEYGIVKEYSKEYDDHLSDYDDLLDENSLEIN